MSDSHDGLGIYDGFEGHLASSEEEVLELLQSCPVILDTNTLLRIYSFEEADRELALDFLKSIKDQLWVPHQVMREFWRNRTRSILDLPSPKKPLQNIRTEFLKIVSNLNHITSEDESIAELKETIEAKLLELEEAINSARGETLDIRTILENPASDPVLQSLSEILNGRVGAPPDDEAEMIQTGLARFQSKTPPGYKDADKKKDQVPEHGTGDYLLWEQTLRYVEESNPDADAFIIVSNDAKEDWRETITGSNKYDLGARPELILESLERTGRRLVLLKQSDFYHLMTKLQAVDEQDSESLVEASAATTSEDETFDDWSEYGYRQLISGLRDAGYWVQADIIRIAAQDDGFISRSAIYEHAGYSESRSLRRFAYPAQRLAGELVEDGVISEDTRVPLAAVYDGPGGAIGYSVPDEFVEFEEQGALNLTWLQAAATVAAEDPDRVWTDEELVEGIREQGLRDLSNSRTPVKTLRRDILQRGGDYFYREGDGFVLRSDEDDEEELAD